MAPDTLETRAILTTRAIDIATQKGISTNNKEYSKHIKKYVDPRGIPPIVVEHTIRTAPAMKGNIPNTFQLKGQNIDVIINQNGDVITVKPK